MMEKKELNNKQKKEILKAMVDALSWNRVKDFITSHHELLEKFQRGGWRLEPSKKDHVAKIIVAHTNEEDHIHLFFSWYKEKEKYIEQLDPFFQSDEYKNWAKEKKVIEGKYALPQKEFYKFYYCLSKLDAMIFLLFSTIQFSHEQIEAMMEIPDQQSQQDDLKFQKGKLSESIQSEEGKLKEKIKELRSEITKLNKENKKLRPRIEKLKEIEIENSETINSMKEELSRLNSELELKVEVIEHDMNEKLEKCKEARDRAKWYVKHFRAQLNEANNKLSRKANELERLNENLKELQTKEKELFHRILDKLNFQDLFAQLNEPDDVKDILSSLVKPPTVDSNESDINVSANLRDFWNKLIEREKELLNRITSIKASSIVEGTYFHQWADHKDDFDDLIYSLRARVFLANLIYKIIKQQQD